VTTEDYAQHFTPLPAVDLAYDLIDALYGPPRHPRLIDPACGEGAFLFRAIERGLTSPDRVFGIERDPELACRFFGGRHGPRAAVADALGGLAAPGAFDLVVANPPYGTGAAGLREIGEREAARLAEIYALWALPRRPARVPLGRLRSYPAELLFLELCLSLVRPGGYVAMIVPEGIAANARYAPARARLLSTVQLDAVISLPKSTFRRTGAAAKTVLLLMTATPPGPAHRVLLGEVGDWPAGAQSLSSVAHHRQSDPQLIHRLDPAYWHPSYDELLAACRLPLQPLGDFISDLTYGPIVTGRDAATADCGPRTADSGRTVALVNQGQVGFCGVDLTAAPLVAAAGPWVSARSRLQPGDVVLPRSGEGSLGKHRVAVFLDDRPAGVGSFVDLIRLQGLNPFYLAAFLKSTLGRSQVSRVANGVGVPNISFDEIRRLQVPALPERAQQAIERRYRRDVLPLHQQATRRHAALQRTASDPRRDPELRQLRDAGEKTWGEVIGELDQTVLWL
jgi:type I restriction enzyme M protein